MRKFRNIIIGLIAFCSTILFSACSCGEKPDTTVYPTSITLSCVDTDNYTSEVKDGVLQISVYKNTVFKIDYVIEPSDVTSSQVDITIQNEGKQAVRPFGNSLSITGVENSFEFRAIEKGESVITFSLHQVKDAPVTASCIVNVSEQKNRIEQLVIPRGLAYTVENHTLTWDKVEATVNDDGEETSIMQDGVAVGLSAYEVKVVDEEGYETIETVTTNSYSNFELGKTYTVSVKAIGNKFDARDSEDYSLEYTFCQLEAVNDLSVEDGVVSWSPVPLATNYKVYYGIENQGQPEERECTEEVAVTTYTLGTGVHLDEYNVYVVAYPQDGLIDETKDYVEVYGVRYFKSPKSTTTLSVVQIKDLEWHLDNTETGEVEVADTTFQAAAANSVLTWNFENDMVYPSQYEIGYIVKVFECDAFGDVAVDATPVLSTDKVSDVKISFGNYNSQGYYKVQVQAVGNSTNTLKPRLMETDAIFITPQIDEDEISIVDNKIKYQSSNEAGYAAIEYYFVEETNPDYNFMYKTDLDELTLSNIGLNSGTYDVYAKIVGDSLVSTNSSVSAKLTTFTILGTVANSYMLKNGNICFTPVTNADIYSLKITRNTDTDSPAPTTIPVTLKTDASGAYVNIFEDLKAYLEANSLEDIDNFLTAGTHSYSLIARSLDTEIIDGGESTPTTFYRQNTILSATLNNGVVSWMFNEAMFTTNTEVGITLNETLLDGNFRNQTSLDTNTNSQAKGLITLDSNNGFEFVVLGKNGNATEPCVLDSKEVFVAFAVTNLVTELNVVDTLFDWSVDDTAAGDNYRLNIYKYIDGVDDQLLDYIDDISDTSVTLETISNKIKAINDSANAENNLISKRIGITVTQINSSKFTNVESAKYYFYYYDSPALSLDYLASDQSYNLNWKKINSVEDVHTVYDLRVTHRLNTEAVPNAFITQSAIQSTTTSYKLGVLGGTLQAGLYDATLTVKVVDSYYGNEYVNSVDDPYYLFATSTTTSYTIVDGATCQFKYQDKNLIWTDMSAEIANLGAYTLKYKVAGSEGDYALLADNIITNSYGNFASLSSNAYEFQLTINPSYSYSQDKIGINYILTNNILTINNITKLETVQVAGTFDGGFYFNSPDLSRDNTYEIYKNNMLQVNNTDYIITETITNTTNYTYYVKFNFNLQESVNFTFRVSAANCIDSDMSTTFNVRPILVPTLSNVTARDTSNNLVHMLKWANTSDQISHFILRQISPSLSTTLHVTDAVTSFDNDYLDGFYLVDGYYYYVFDDTTIVNAGTYRYTIKAYTTTSGYLNSNDSVESLIVKLANTASMSVVNGSVVIEQPTGLNISNTYKLNITLYTIDSETQEKVYDDTHSKELTLTTSYTHTVDFGDYDELSEQGAYAITVQYIGGYEVVDQGTQKTVYYIDSNLSAEKYVIKAGKPSVYMLNGAVAWTNPIGSVATSINYDVKITNTVDSTEHYSLTTTGTELTNALINEHNINFAENSTYTVTVSANTSGYISSEMSDAYTVIKLIKAEDFRIDVEMGTTEEDDEGNLIEVSTKVFKWANNNPRFREDDEGLYVKVGENYVLYDESATAHETLQRYSYTTTSYKIFYVDGEGNEVAVQTVGDNLNVISQSINTALVVGEYTCYMQIIGSTDLNTMSVGYISSDISNKVTLSIRQESESVRVVNNQLAWDTVDGAYAYRVVFDYLGTDTSVTQGFSIHTRECLLDLGATEMSNYNVFGMYEVKVFAYTGHTESNSYLITTNTSDEYGYNQKNKLSLFKADSVVDYKILDGMFSWSFSLESINKYLEYNQINVSLLKEGGFETGLEENIEREYTDIEKNQVRAIRYIQGRINGTIPADENLDKALSPYLNFKMKVNGVEIEVTPSKIEGLNGEGIPVDFKPATYLSATKVRYYYDLVRDNKDSETLNVTTGFYDVYVASYGNTNLPTEANTAIVSSNYSDVKKVYKPSTPIAATANDLYSDIVDSNVYWNLVTTDNTLMGSAEFFAEYRIEATPFIVEGQDPNPEQTPAYANVSLNGGNMAITNTGNEPNFNIKNVNVSSLFSTAEADKTNANYILANEAYNLGIYVRGTQNSDDVTFAAGEEEYYYINGSSMTINTYMCMLDTPVDFHIANGVITWTNSLYASKIRLKIYGAYDLEYDYATGQEAEYNTRNWYLHAYDNVAGTTTLHNGIEIEEIELNTSGADGINRYVLGSKFIKGGYAVSAQAIGNGLGVVDSNLTDADHSVYAVKLDTTEVGLNKGNFVWPLVQDATSYYVEIYGQKKDGSDAGQTQVPVGTFHYASNIVTKEINGVRHAVYDLDGSYNDETVNYYIRVSPRNLSITQNVGYLYGDFAKSAAYGRLNAPELTEINDRGELWWDTSKISISHIERFVLYSNYSDREDNTVTIETECGDQNYAVLTPDEEYASQAFTVQVRVMSSVDNMLNSAKSDGFMVLKMQEPDLRIENGNVAWNNQPSNSLGSEVVDSNLSITYTKGGSPTALFEGTVKATDPHVFMFYQEVEDNKYSSMVADGTYPATNYNVKVSFVGTVFDSSDIEGSEGSEGEEDENIDKYYYLASIEKQATVNKLSKPSLSSSSVQEGDAVVSYARWLQNESTTEYAVYVYATYGAGNKNHVSSRYDTMTKGTYFKKETVEGRNYVFFNIDAILNDGGDISAVATEEKLKLFIYAQAVGTINSKTLEAGARLYVNSNFSDSLEISVPPTPIITSYADGKLTWETVVESGYDIEGVISYEAQVNEDLLNNYWLITSNKTQEGEGGFVTNDAVNASVRQSEVTHRELTYTLANEINGVKYYTIKVSDNIKLYPEQQQTQTYYYLNQVGTNYVIKLRACVHSEDAGVVEGNYKSAWTEEYKIQNMLLFADGDGTTLNPYIISDEAQLLRMGNYPSRHFKLGAENITVSDWSMIFTTKENEFTGTLDGNGYTINIANISLHEVGASDIGFIGYNAGTISNLQINYIDVAVVSNVTNIGGIVVWNGGTLQQVSVKGYLAVARADNNNGSIVLGGIATHNGYSITVSNVTNTYNGTITYATVSAQLTTQTKNGNTSEVGGIAAKNSGTISYSGVLENAYLKANWVGGITVTNNATGKITHSFNKGVCEVYDKNTVSEYSTVYLGGIVANNVGDIDYSYSIAEFRLIRESSTTYYVGGLVGVNNTATTIALNNNYTVFRLHKDSAVTSANASAEIGAVVGRCNNNASNTSNKWRVYYYVEDTIAGYSIKPIGSARTNVTTGDLVSKAAAEMKNDTFASTLGAASFSYYNYINNGYPVLNFEFNLMFAANDYYYVVEVDIKEAYYREPGSQDRIVVPNTSLSDGYEFKEQNPDDVQYAYTLVLEYTVTYAGEVTLTGEVTADSAYCYYSDEKPDGDTRNFAASASTLGEYVIRVYLSGDFVTFGDIQTSPYCTTGVDDRYGAFVEFTWKLVLGD